MKQIKPGKLKTLSPSKVEDIRYDGYLLGKYFSGEWPDGSDMSGYGIYSCDDGEVAEFGKFSESGELEDREYAGDLIESENEESFTILEGC